GFVVRLARGGILRLTGWRATQPLSGMRCVSRAAFEQATPLARGWGVEVGLTVDVLQAGLRIVEVPCELHHRVSGRGWRAQLHRGRQYRDVWLALAERRLSGAALLRRVPLLHPVLGADAGPHHAAAPTPGAGDTGAPGSGAPGSEARNGRGRR